jgi:hypothetical protein
LSEEAGRDESPAELLLQKVTGCYD